MPARNVFGLILMAMIGAWWTVALPVEAAPPWGSLFSLRRVEANPEKSYQLTEEEGPWLILAATFSGEGAQEQAHALVLELRRRYKLPAYVHKMRFDFDKKPDGRGYNRFVHPQKLTYRRGSEIEEIAVLVGDFPSIDDPTAKEILKKIKFAEPDCLDIEKVKQTNLSLAAWRDLQKQLHRKLSKHETTKTKKGPMGHAFMTRNPLRAGECSTKGLDPFVVKMNRGVKHSLLDCPGKFTVQVAHFRARWSSIRMRSERSKRARSG